jgi:hypothetical protein
MEGWMLDWTETRRAVCESVDFNIAICVFAFGRAMQGTALAGCAFD